MSRKWIVCVVLPVLAVLLVGCPKKKPQPAKEEIKMETRKVEPPTQEMPEVPTPPPADQQEVDPLASEDLRLVNEAAQTQGFAANVYFDFDKSDLKPEAREALAGNAQFLRRHPEFTVTIEGHCDERDTNEYNLALGERRSQSTKAYLASLGVGDDRLQTISYGEERPVCTQSEESCWWQNRRSHMVITGRSR
jgi:peptidoglycan-associated lipoprotein